MNLKKNIPSAGPSITEKEVEYVTDACRNGWYSNWSGYLDKFEKAFGEMTGTKYVLATSSCTGALHISMAALGLGPGDEVIVPEVSWVATASCVCYVGAKPIFVDVEKDTWCLDPQKVKDAITPRTKAIIPVHMYGHPANMDAINEIAEKNGLYVIEDAAPGIGSQLNDRPVGSLGLAAAFSFQGAKPLAMGEGGALVTNDEKFYKKAYQLWDHGRNDEGILQISKIGFKYKLSNIQAALGLAQVERREEIIYKRRQIFFWFQDRLKDIEGLSMNAERPGVFNNFYVPTIILDKKFKVDSEELSKRMTAEGIGNRPFFRCLSQFPMFASVEAPVANHLAKNGINLPCSSNLTEDDAEITANFIRKELLG